MRKRDKSERSSWLDQLTPAIVLVGFIILLIGIAVKYARPQPKWVWGVVIGIGAALLIGIFIARFDAVLRYLLTRRGRMGSNAVLSVLLMTVVVVMINWIGDRHHARFDWTKTKRHSLSPQTLKILKGLKKNINIVGFYRRDSFEFERIRDLLESYDEASPKVKAMVVDPRQKPLLAEKYNVTSTSVVVFECDGKRETVSFGDEQEFTNAILKLTRMKKKKIYFVQGHGEHGYDSYDDEGLSSVKNALEKLEYKVDKLELFRKQQVPRDCDVLVIAGPTKPFMPVEIDALRQYLEDGGKALIMLDPKSPSFSEILSDYGIDVKSGIVFDIVTLARDPRGLLITGFEWHDITRPFMKARAMALLFVACRALKKAESPPEGYQVSELLKTTSESWIKQHLMGDIRPTADDERGPFAVAIAIAPSAGASSSKEKKTRLVVTGDSDFATNRYVGAFYNADFFINSINWLAQEEELIEIQRKQETPDTFVLTRGQQVFIFAWSVIGLPLLVLVIGGIVWFLRR